MTAALRVYLAGPDVFMTDPEARGAALKAACAAVGLVGVFPLDPLPHEPSAWDQLPEWRRLALRNEAHIRACDALIANLTPFRGPSADPGTVFELGFMRALGRPVFGWSADPRPFEVRTRAHVAARPGGDGIWRDGDGLAIEAFGCVDNLMLDGALADGGGVVLGGGEAGTDLALFRRCAAAAAVHLRADQRYQPR